MGNEYTDLAEKQMGSIIEASKEEFAGIRSGRANAALLNRIQVDYYGSFTPLQNLGTINVADAKSLVISVYDQGAISAIEKALSSANMGLAASVEGQNVRVTVPSLTAERREEYVKLAKAKGEEVKISIRNVRQKIRQDVAAKVKAKAMPEDQEKHIEKELDQITHSKSEEIDKIVANKVAELQAV